MSTRLTGSLLACATASLLLGSAGCVQEGQYQLVAHPTEDNLLDPKLVTHNIARRQDGPEWQHSEAALLRQATMMWTVGSDHGDPVNVFGTIQDVAMDTLGRIFVLDARTMQVRLWSREGAPLARVGKFGRERNALQSPTALDLAEDGTLVVADRGRRVKLFRPRDSGYDEEVAFRSRVVPDDVCAGGGRIFVRGWHNDGAIVHEYDRLGQYRRSLVPGYASRSQLVAHQLSDGRMTCMPVRRVIVVTFNVLPYIYAYSFEGERLWVSQLDDFMPRATTERRGPEGSVTLISDRGAGLDRVVSLVPLSTSVVLLQVERQRISDDGARLSRVLETYLLSIEDGRAAYVGDQLGLVAAGRWPRLVVVEARPYFRLVVYDAPETGNERS